MKQKLHIFMTLLLLMICGGVSFGQTTATLKFTKACGGSGTDDQKNAWTITSDATESVFSSSQGIHYGTSSAEVTYIKATTDAYADKEITKIVVNASANTNGSPKVSCTVGGKSFGTEQSLGTSNKAYTFEGTASGAIEVAITKSKTKKALYLLSVEVTYKDGGSSDKTSTKLSFGTEYDGKTVSTKAGEILETPATLTPAVSGATISYDSSDKTVAEIDKDGVVYAYKEGTTTITASYAGDVTYAASSASYTLNVEDARTATTLTFPTSSYTFGQGDQKGTAVIEDNAAILTPEGAGKVTYSVTGTDGLADFMEDGSVLVNTNVLGTATITASFAGNDTYKASEASYTITVKVIIGDEKFDFTKPELYGKGVSSGSGVNYKSDGDIAVGESISSGKIKLTVTKENSTNPTRFWNGDIRTYADAQWTLTVDNGYIISNVKITTKSGSKGNFKIGEFGGRNVTIDFSGTGAKTMTSMTVTYAKLPTATLTTAASGFATYAADYDVDYSAAGLKAYAITLDDAAKTVKYTEATGVVPAGKAVLVKSESKTEYTLAPATEDAADFTTDLQISDGTVTTEGGLYYAFATVDGKSGFKKLADGLTIPAKKGYLILSAASAKGFFAFDETTTGINEIEAEAAQDNAAIYNLAGQRVSKDYKGVVIKNGKKFLNK